MIAEAHIKLEEKYIFVYRYVHIPIYVYFFENNKFTASTMLMPVICIFVHIYVYHKILSHAKHELKVEFGMYQYYL